MLTKLITESTERKCNYVEIELDPQEGVVAESGSFMMMDDGIKMENHFWRWF